MKVFYTAFILFCLVFTPSVILAGDSFGNDNTSSGFGNDNTPPNYSNNNGESIKLANPLGDINSFPELIKAILDAAFIIGLPIAVLFIVFAGFRFVWARGNTTELAKAKTNLLYTIIGIAVFFGAWLITSVIVGTLRTLNIDI